MGRSALLIMQKKRQDKYSERTHDESIEIGAAPAQVWKLLAEVAGWKKWNAGIESIEMHGPFVAGTTFSMKPPGEDGFTSTLLEVKENEGFVDETVIGGTRVVVDHRLALLPSGKTRVTYSRQNHRRSGRRVHADGDRRFCGRTRCVETPGGERGLGRCPTRQLERFHGLQSLSKPFR